MHLDLGTELRRVRQLKKLSLRAVADAVGVSASLLSQVETGKTQPSVSTLYALVSHLEISLDGLMGNHHTDSSPARTKTRSAKSAPSSVVQRAGNNPVIEMENGVTWERLADGGSSVADPLIVTYAPGGSSSVEGKLMRHAALEYGTILQGALTLRVDFETYELTEGDSFCFDAGRPHLYENRSTGVARGMWFVIGRREMGYQTLADLGLRDNAGERQVKSAIDVLAIMNSDKG